MNGLGAHITTMHLLSNTKTTQISSFYQLHDLTAAA